MTMVDEKLDPPVAVIGYGYWQRRFGGAPGAIGRTISFRNRILYGILSYSVALRRAEFGVRMALGATPSRVASAVLREVLLQVAAGMGIGLAVTLATVRTAKGLLFGVTPADPGNYLLSAAVLAVVACLAAWLPARRAYSIDPSETLRLE